MSRVAKMPVAIPAGVQVTVADGNVVIKGAKASQTLKLPKSVQLEVKDGVAALTSDSIKANKVQAGTTRALLSNAIQGVTKGFDRKLTLVGVGYRAAAQGKVLNLQVGLSHHVNYPIPEGITVETPSQTEIIVKGASKQLVGQVAAEIRSYRKPEPYKGKGVRYADEKITLKEAKKK